MPVTYNGVGTHYYGKKNIQKRLTACPHCGRQVELTSYDTRLWFVVVFIPVIPLGRKRIIDQCPACRRHYVANLDKWETAKQLEVSGAQDKFRSDPTPENAIAAHAQLMNFHQAAEAAEFQKTMLEKFGDNAKVRAYLGIALERQGQLDQATEHYERALALRSDLPEARVGVARARIRAGQLGEARRLLDFLEKSGAAQLYSLEPLEVLGLAYQRAGQHNEALEMFEKLQTALPQIAQVKGFRDMVKKSEKALGRPTSILPKQKFSWKRIFQVGGGNTGTPQLTWRSLGLVGIIIALMALGFVISNEFIRRHRTVYVVNATGAPATVNIAGAGTVQNFKGLRQLKVAEGAHHATITGAVNEQVDFTVRDDYFNRWFGDPVWVLNVGKAALLMKEDATYAASDPPPPIYTFFYGQSFQFFADIKYVFKPLPKSIEVQSGESRTVTGLRLFDGDATDVFRYYLKQNVAEAWKFAETWLHLHPDDTSLLHLYAATAREQKQTNRFDTLLLSGLTNRPVQIEWHRLYQGQHEGRTEIGALKAEYDKMLAADPNNSALLYLRGRIEADRPAARDYFQRATNADARNPFPLVALAFDRVAAADWSGAEPLLTTAFALNPSDLRTDDLLTTTRLALGEAADVEKIMRKRLAKESLDFYATMHLIESLMTQSNAAAVAQSSTAFASGCRARLGSEADSVIRLMRYEECYVTGDFAALEKAAAADKSVRGQNVLAIALIEQGRLADALAASSAESDEDERPQWDLAVAIACSDAGKQADAETWATRAAEAMASGNEDFARAAELMTQITPPTLAEIKDATVAPRFKAAMVTWLAQKFPQKRAEYLELARQLNVERRFPYHLIQRVTSKL